MKQHSLILGTAVLIGSVTLACTTAKKKSNDESVRSRDQAAAEGSSDALTYYKDVKPIIDGRCVSCHVAGGAGGFPLTSYTEVHAMRLGVQSSTTNRRMPPAPAGDGCNEYVSDTSLTEAQIKLISDWVNAGAPEGDAEAEGPALDKSNGLSRVDLTLAMPEAYTPKAKADDYRCFVLDWPNAEASYITGFQMKPGNASVVHHVIAFLAPPDLAAQATALDAAEAGPGYTCFGGSGIQDPRMSWVGAWAPGAAGADYPAGTGLKILPGSKIILQIHYNTHHVDSVTHEHGEQNDTAPATKTVIATSTSTETNLASDDAKGDDGKADDGKADDDEDVKTTTKGPGQTPGQSPTQTYVPGKKSDAYGLSLHEVAAVSDLSTMELKVDASVATEAYFIPYLNPGWVANPPSMLIPAGATDVKHQMMADLSAAKFGGAPLHLHMAALHMHTYGKSGKLVTKAESEDQCLLDIEKWDFHSQKTYWFTKPQVLAPGSQLYLECTWDNPTAKDKMWGEGTDDEMCLGLLYVTIKAN
jgi:hypothetical protein